MNKYIFFPKYTLFSALVLSSIVTSSVVANDHDYQVTGSVVAIADNSITIMKGSTHWMIAKNTNTHTLGNIRLGDKVAIKYHMVADHIVTKSLKEEKVTKQHHAAITKPQHHEVTHEKVTKSLKDKVTAPVKATAEKVTPPLTK